MDNMARKMFAERLRVARQAAGYTSAKAFSDSIGLAQPKYRNYEIARNFPRDAEIYTQLATALGVDENWLRTGKGHPFPDSQEDSAQLMSLFDNDYSDLNEYLIINIFKQVSKALNHANLSDVKRLKLTLQIYSDVARENLCADDAEQRINELINIAETMYIDDD